MLSVTSQRKEHLWNGEHIGLKETWACPPEGSVSSVEIHGAGAQAPALPEFTASLSLKRVVAGFVQVVQGSSSFHVGAARFRRSVALQLLHQHLAAATQNIPELPQRAAALQGSAAVLHTNTDTHSSTHSRGTNHVEENMCQVSAMPCFFLKIFELEIIHI